MIDHIGIGVSSYDESKRFYLATLAPLGYGVVMEFERVCGFGAGGKPDFWIHEEPGVRGPLHVAFSSEDRAAVDRFYEAAIAAGGKDNGAPGLRPQYHPSYYGAFVLDPDGNNVEAVCHRPEAE